MYWCEIVYYYGTSELTCLCGSETVPCCYPLTEVSACVSGVDLFLLELMGDDEVSIIAGLKLY